MRNEHLIELLTAIGDDELILGHRDSEWTGHAPILEEDIAFSNLAQDEVGHSLLWYTLLEGMTHTSPDAMGFERGWKDFRCCHFVTYPKGDFAYTLVRQYLFDVAEQIRLRSFLSGSNQELRSASEKILPEEAYHLRHSEGLVQRLGDATVESHTRMQAGLDAAFPQALGLFEPLVHEERLIEENIFQGNSSLMKQWLERVTPVLRQASLDVPHDAAVSTADYGGRKGKHTDHLKDIVGDLQAVYQSEPGATW
jgi:ring-1,2-phenylacetyl-CoA epoxidase subunit PaaC